MFGEEYHGHLYSRRADLSPNGQYFLYFHQDRHVSDESVDSTHGRSGTCISVSPTFIPIDFWFKENFWHGGGLFLSQKKVWINETENRD